MKKRLLSILLALVMALSLLPTTALAYGPFDSVPLNLTVSSYGAPFLNGSTGQHTVSKFQITKYIDRTTAAGTGANASGSATARFVGSNEAGWTLVIDVTVGNYTETWTTNAKITNKDMSEATGSVTFGMSWNTQNGVSTYISISGAKALPQPDTAYTLYYNGNGGVPQQGRTFTNSPYDSYTFTVKDDTPTNGDKHFMGWADTHTATTAQYQPGDKITLYKANPTKTIYAVWGDHTDANDDGFCDNGGECLHNHDNEGYCTEENCDHPHGDNDCCPLKPQQPTVPGVPSDYDKLKELLGDEIVKIDCTNTEIDPQHSDGTYGLLAGSYTIGDVEKNQTTGVYTCEITVTPDAYVAKYNEEIGVNHTLTPESQTETITLHYAPVNADGTVSTWQVKSVVPVTFTVLCETPEEKPEAPTDLSNILTGNFVTVECISTNTHDKKSLSYGLLPGGYTIGGVEGDAANGYTCKVTFDANTYQAKYNDDTTSKHELDPQEQLVSIVLTWDKETGWTAPDRYAVRFTVTCDGDSSYYTVTYTDGVDDVVFADQTYYVRAGEKTPAFVGTPTRAGYTFTGWDPAVAATVTGDVTYTAQWRRSYHHTTSTEAKPTLNKADHYAYVVGYPDGTVQPQGAITRAEVATIFFRLLSDETRDLYWTKDNAYTDVKAGDWFNNAVSTLSNAGIINGYPDGTFRPNAPITRAEMAKVIAMFAELDKDSEGFKDIAGHWAEAYIKLAAGNGWIAGYPDGTFRPDQYITRAETMTMINRVLERVPSEEEHLLSHRVMLTFPDNQPGDWYYIAVQEATNSHTYERYATEKNGDEQWIKLIDNYDWTKLEF